MFTAHVRRFTTGFTKAELQPTDGHEPNHVAVDETVIRLTDEQYRVTLPSIRRISTAKTPANTTAAEPTTVSRR